MDIRNKLISWANQVVGTPFVDKGRDLSGLDCWGLVLAAYKACFGIDLPYGSTLSCKEPEKAAKALLDGARQWKQIPLGEEMPGDVILARPCHAAMVVGQGRMLNCREGAGTIIERYDNAIWRRAITGIYRHVELAAG